MTPQKFSYNILFSGYFGGGGLGGIQDVKASYNRAVVSKMFC